MSPELRKLAVQSMVSMMRNQTLKLAKEFEEIRARVTEIRNNPKNKQSHICRTAGEVLDELEELDHAGKLNRFTTGLAEILEDVRDTDPEGDFAQFIPRIEKIEIEAQHHFDHVIPALHEKLSNAMRMQAEMN